MIISSAMLLAACAPAQNKVATPADSAVEQSATQATLAAHPDNKPGNDADELWGETVPDPYRWLEDPNGEGVADWIAQQHSRASQYLKQLPKRDAFAKRLADVVYMPSISQPAVTNGKMFYTAKQATDEKVTYYVRNLGQTHEQARVLIDQNKLSDDGSVSVGRTSVSKSGKYMAYTLKKNNADTATLYIMDVETGETLADVIDGARYASPSWLPDDSGFYYTHFPTDESIPVDQRPGETDIRFHKLGTSQDEDTVVLTALHDATKFQNLSVNRDGKWLIHTVDDGWNGNSIRIKRRDSGEWIDMNMPADTANGATIVDDVLYLITNDGAPKYKIVRIPLNTDKPDITKAAHQVIIPEDASPIDDFTVAKDKLVIVKQKDAISHLYVYTLDGALIKEIELPDKGEIQGTSIDKDNDVFYYTFASFKMPKHIYSMTMDSLESKVWDKVDTKIDVDQVVVEQIFATSKDGTQVPMFVIRRKDTPLDGTAKTIIYGYGGFNVSINPSFSVTAHTWVEQGGIYVYSNLRGGSEYGEEWHRNGMRMNKQNVFDDYYAVAETLIERKYTSAKHVAAYGGSNGGLLVGAALTQRPDLYGAVVCAVPLLDMIRFHKFGSGRTWTSEYMSSDESKEAFEYIRSYSPYANVKAGTNYPPVLFLGADSDDRVDPMHARKMTAAIQDANANDNPVLLRIEKNAGHGGAGLLSSTIDQYADVFAFLDSVL